MDAQKLAELEAAIVAHCERLKVDGVTLPVPPGEVRAPDVMQMPLTDKHSAMARALVTNLRAFTGLRALAKIRQHRAESREEAQRASRAAASEHRSDAERCAKQVELVTDSSHFERLAPALKELESRLRTARKKLKGFGVDLDLRHRDFVRHRLAVGSGAALDKALANWLSTHCLALEAEIEFFLGEIQGPTSMQSTGHPGPADSKAWNRVFGEAVATLKDAGVNAAERRALFPLSFPDKPDIDARRRQREREYKAAKRAKSRRKSKG